MKKITAKKDKPLSKNVFKATKSNIIHKTSAGWQVVAHNPELELDGIVRDGMTEKQAKYLAGELNTTARRDLHPPEFEVKTKYRVDLTASVNFDMITEVEDEEPSFNFDLVKELRQAIKETIADCGNQDIPNKNITFKGKLKKISSEQIPYREGY